MSDKEGARAEEYDCQGVPDILTLNRVGFAFRETDTFIRFHHQDSEAIDGIEGLIRREGNNLHLFMTPARPTDMLDRTLGTA
ncbi:MAG: hypothetical protein AB1733_16090 [Thermodesulfobacteriota bacterium]